MISARVTLYLLTEIILSVMRNIHRRKRTPETFLSGTGSFRKNKNRARQSSEVRTEEIIRWMSFGKWQRNTRDTLLILLPSIKYRRESNTVSSCRETLSFFAIEYMSKAQSDFYCCRLFLHASACLSLPKARFGQPQDNLQAPVCHTVYQSCSFYLPLLA